MTTDRKICSTYRGYRQRQPFSLPPRAREGSGADDGAGGRSQVRGCARRQSVQTTSIGYSASCARSDFPAGGRQPGTALQFLAEGLILVHSPVATCGRLSETPTAHEIRFMN